MILLKKLSSIDSEGFKEYCHLQNMSEGTIRNYLYELKKIPLDKPKKYIAQNNHKRLLIFAFRSYSRYLNDIGKITNEELFTNLRTFKPPKRKGKTEKGNWYPKEEWENIISKAPNRCAKLGIYIGLQFGLRLGEIINLRIQDVDFKTNHIHVQKHPEWSPKYGKERSIPMHSKQIRILARWIKNKPTMNHDYLLWSGRKKVQVSERTFERWCHKTQLGLKPHDLRRSFAKVLYYRSKRDIYLVCQLLGHESVSTTTTYLGLETREIKKKYTEAMS